MNKNLKDRYIDFVMAETFNEDASMRKHFEKDIADVVELENGDLISIEKKKVKTRFCFGYSLYDYDCEDYDRANKASEEARRSVEYFIAENLKEIDSEIESFSTLPERHFVPVARVHYYNAPETTKIKCISWVKFWDFEERNAYKKSNCYILNYEDRKLITRALEEERERFKKRLLIYLKKYGLKYVKSWSYWQDQ